MLILEAKILLTTRPPTKPESGEAMDFIEIGSRPPQNTPLLRKTLWIASGHGFESDAQHGLGLNLCHYCFYSDVVQRYAR
jgi:hypothetical protein